jgi:AraC-like DNA-binding protein
MPRYAPDAVIDPDTATCPIVGLAVEKRGHRSDWHAHRRAQLLYQAVGAVTLHTADHIGQLAPSQAVWLPAGLRHRTTMHGTFSYRSLYFDVDVYPDLPVVPVILEINALARELILRVADWAADAVLTAEQARLVATLLDELAAAQRAPLHLPMPREKRVLAVAHALLDDPASAESLSAWGARVGASERTLARGFVRETGMTFAQWRTQCRLLVAQSRLAEGVSVTSVAHLVGYASDSAFIAMYRRLYGVPPGRRTRASAAGNDDPQD